MVGVGLGLGAGGWGPLDLLWEQQVGPLGVVGFGETICLPDAFSQYICLHGRYFCQEIWFASMIPSWKVFGVVERIKQHNQMMLVVPIRSLGFLRLLNRDCRCILCLCRLFLISPNIFGTVSSQISHIFHVSHRHDMIWLLVSRAICGVHDWRFPTSKKVIHHRDLLMSRKF